MTEPALRLLFVGPNLGAGGAERQWSILLPALRARGHDARLIALDGGGAFEPVLRAAGVPVEVIAMRHQLDLGRLLRADSVRRFDPDVVVSRGVSGAYVGHAIARRRRGAHVHADHRGVGLTLSPRRQRMFALLAGHLDGVVLVSADQVEIWRRWGVRPERAHVVPNGVPAFTGAGARDELRAQLGLAPGAVLAVTVGSMRPVKRHVDFVAAVRLAARRRPELVGAVVGDGPERAAVQAAAGGSEHVRLLGHRDDVERVLGAADAFVLASEFEAAPMAILEAMAAGLPVIASRVGAIPAIVQEGASGLLVAPRAPEQLADALVALAADPGLRARMGAAGAELHRAHYDAAGMVDAYERIFSALAPRPAATVR